MTFPHQRRFGRRALLAGSAGVVGGLVVYEVAGVLDDDQAGPGVPAVPRSGAQTTAVTESGQAVDLTVRWCHLERRVRDAKLLAGWQFDEGAGYAFEDVSGHEHTLHVTGLDWNTSDSGLVSGIHQRGFRGGAVALDETRWLAATPSARLVPGAGLTLGCRVRLDRLPTESAVLIAFGGAYTLTLSPDGQLVLTVNDRASIPRVLHSPAHAVTPDQWVHLAATVEPRTGLLRMYVDGDPVGRSNTEPFALSTSIASLVVGGRLSGRFDEVTLHRAPLSAQEVRTLCVVGLPTVYAQTAESIDPGRSVFTQFKGSDPIPHPVDDTTVLTQRFAGSTRTDQGVDPISGPATPVFVPGVFGGSWRATHPRLDYPSPVTGDSGTFEAWHRVFDDPHDPDRQRRKEIFVARGRAGLSLTLFSASSRWQVEVRRSGGRSDTLVAPSHPFLAGNLEHVAVAWGEQGGTSSVVLYVNGVPAASLPTRAGDTSYNASIGLGGPPDAPTYALLDDARICDVALPWGEICPRGHATTDAAGLDLRDRLDRPPGAAPMLWRPGLGGGSWSHRSRPWERPEAVGADPDSARALCQTAATGQHAAFHPDAYGHASSIEVGVSFAEPMDGWAGVFMQADDPQADLSGLTFMVNPARSQLRLARLEGGHITASKMLPHDFAIRPRATYELTLTNCGDGVLRGFVDGTNMISMRTAQHWPDRGYAGMVTQDARAYFSDLHFCALTPATPQSRVVRTRVVRAGAGADVQALGLVPFRWHKRRGLLPWQYTFKDPEPAGNIAGADTALPLRPLAPAEWRGEDSANSDLVTVDGRVHYLMRGNPRVDHRAGPARVGVLHADVDSFDGLHFADPNRAAGHLTGGTVLASGGAASTHLPVGPGSLQLNDPSSAYVGDGRLLFLGRESTVPEPGADRLGRLAYSRFDVGTDTWEESPQHLPWALRGPLSTDGDPGPRHRFRATPELVSLRNPDDDAFRAVLFQQVRPDGPCVMETAMLDDVTEGTPTLNHAQPVRRSLSRASGGAIYGFRVLFDNGIYYLHYNDGPRVPDWPDRFVLAATLDPYAGPWVVNAETTRPESTYFRRGTALEPDNGAIWQGTMFKLRGRYYLYYENFHATDDVDQPYQNYADPQNGSRVGFATA